MNRTVYRIQHIRSRLGPFNHNPRPSIVDDVLCDIDGPGRIPPPGEDIGIDRIPKPNEICCFITHEQLRYCFNKTTRKVLKRYGFRVFKFKAKVTALGEYQALCERPR